MNFLEPFEILKHLDKLNIVKETTTEYHCTCPVCGDGGFKIEKETGVFNAFKCGCEIPKIREAIKPLSQAFEEILPPRPVNPFKITNYRYTTWSGEPRAAVKRIDDGEGKKNFRQAHWTGEDYKSGLPDELREDLAIYRWPEVRQAMKDGEAYIFWVEGEKSADALWELGLPATTSIGGCSGYESYGVYAGKITGSRVVVCPDMAPDGIKYAKMVQKDYPDCLWLHAFPKAPQWGNIAKGKGHDIENWIADGATVEDILQAIESKPRVYEPVVFSATATELKAKIYDYDAEKDPYEKAVKEQAIRKQFGITSQKIEDLVLFSRGDNIGKSNPVKSILADVFNQVERRASGEEFAAIPTGFSIDSIITGLKPAELYILAGRPSMGKSAAAMEIATNVARSKKVLVFSLEQSKEQLIYRMISAATSITYNQLETGNLNLKEWETFSKSLETINQFDIDIDDTGERTVQSISLSIGSQETLPDFVIIDHLQLIEGTGDNGAAAVTKITKALKNIAKKYNIPVMVLSQLSRGVEQRTDKRPMMSDLRESGSIEQDGDVIILMYRDDYYNPNSPDRGLVEFNIAKHRNGPTGVAKMLFESEFVRFRNYNRMY
jgi:replicative DNA helicase